MDAHKIHISFRNEKNIDIGLEKNGLSRALQNHVCIRVSRNHVLILIYNVIPLTFFFHWGFNHMERSCIFEFCLQDFCYSEFSSLLGKYR